MTLSDSQFRWVTGLPEHIAELTPAEAGPDLRLKLEVARRLDATSEIVAGT
ncbi:hypothetical protein GS449_15005 [Rhodococcus hoagii]|nr:hypothetical protein [Prescottella equi]